MPGRTLRSTTATWRTPSSPDLWKKLEGLARLTSKEGLFLAFGPTLPDEQDDRLAKAVVHRQEDLSELHWTLTVERAPSEEPPQQAREHDRKLGGRSGLSRLLAEALARDVSAVGTFRARCRLPRSGYCCPTVPAMIEKGSAHHAALLLGEARLEQVGYRFDGGVSGIEEISIVYLHVPEEYSLNIAARGPLKLGSPRWLPFADDVVDLALSTFFVSKEVVE